MNKNVVFWAGMAAVNLASVAGHSDGPFDIISLLVAIFCVIQASNSYEEKKDTQK